MSPLEVKRGSLRKSLRASLCSHFEVENCDEQAIVEAKMPFYFHPCGKMGSEEPKCSSPHKVRSLFIPLLS